MELELTEEPLPSTGSISGMFWWDNNGDGIRQEADTQPPRTGGSIDLFDVVTGYRLQRQSISADGTYSFTGLAAGSYRLRPNSDYLTHPGRGSDPTRDSHDPAEILTLADGAALTRIEFGFYDLEHLQGYVWDDVTQDGRRDPQESGIAGVVVTITPPDGADPISRTTDHAGHWFIWYTPPGHYELDVTTPVGATRTVAGNGSNSKMPTVSTSSA